MSSSLWGCMRSMNYERVNESGRSPSPSGRGRRDSQRAGAPGEGCAKREPDRAKPKEKSFRILRPSPCPLPEGEGDLSICQFIHIFYGRRRCRDRRDVGGHRPPLQRTACLLVLLILLLASCRQNMANEPRYSTFQESGFFPNGSSARPLPEGTVPQERERNTHLVKGTVNGQPASGFPFPVTLEVLQRGRQRFDIFCTPCHDHLGTGQGMAVRRGFRETPPSFHIDRLRTAPPGYFFNVITNGFGVMPSYASQIPARERWTIIAYIRALERSWNSTTADVPPGELKRLEAEKQ